MSIEIIDGADDAAIAYWIEQKLQVDLLRADDGPIAVSLPGGATPFPILAQLTGKVIDWRRIEVWPGDDRMVPLRRGSGTARGEIRP